MTAKKMLVSDYDGTFYVSDEGIERNKLAVEKFIANDNLFVIATGRSELDFKNKLTKYQFYYDCVILNHGTTILDKDGTVLMDITIPDAVIPQIKEELDLETSELNFCCSKNNSRASFEDRNLNKIFIKYHSEAEALQKVDAINKKFGQFVIAYFVNTNSVEIISRSTNKAEAIMKVIETEALSKDNVFVVGDGYSDIEMAERFRGYCMPNSVDSLKQIAIGEVASVADLISIIS